MGVPYEFGPATPPDEVRWGRQASYRPQPPGTWSDDGGLMLSLLDSLLQVGFDPKDQGRRALDWWLGNAYKPGEVFDIGLITRESLGRIQAGVEPELAGATGEHENGNGSLMRILPVALTNRGVDDERLVELAMRASSLTHRHRRSTVTCAVYVLVARSLLNGDPDRRGVLDQALDGVKACVENADLAELLVLENFQQRTGSGYVVDTFWSAWDAFETSDSYEVAIRNAISYGNDTDTTAAIAGGLAGIYWGVDGIPIEWMEGMRGAEMVRHMVDQLVEHDRVASMSRRLRA